jgi:hypothetical protein
MMGPNNRNHDQSQGEVAGSGESGRLTLIRSLQRGWQWVDGPKLEHTLLGYITGQREGHVRFNGLVSGKLGEVKNLKKRLGKSFRLSCCPPVFEE